MRTRVLDGFEGVGSGGLDLGAHGLGVWTLTNSMGPGLAGIMEQCHISQPITIIHMAASTQNLGVPEGQGRLLKHARDSILSLPGLPSVLTSLPMTSILCCTWGTHWRTMANSSGMVVCGSNRISWHAGSLGSKKVKAEVARGLKSPQAS